MAFSIKIEGHKAIERRLNALEKKIAKKVLRKAARKGGKIVQQAAKSNAPEDEGDLKKTIKVRALNGRNVIGVRVMTGTREELGISKDDPYYYPAAQEFGTAKMPAHPYMRPALESKREEAKRIFIAELQAGIREAEKA